MAVVGGGAFNGGGSVCDGLRIGDVEANMAIDTKVVGGGSGRQRLTAAMDEGGRWRLTVVMDDCCGSSGQWTIDTSFNGGGGGGV